MAGRKVSLVVIYPLAADDINVRGGRRNLDPCSAKKGRIMCLV